jgi:hypothetical protein
MNHSENINELANALSKAQSQMKPAEKDAENPHFKSSFSSLSSIWESIRQPITNNGLSILQDITTQETSISVRTKIIHLSGQWIELGPLSIPLVRNDAQGIGSATTYAKRYALCAAIGVVSADDDDDGETVDGRGNFPNHKKQTIEKNKEVHKQATVSQTKINPISASQKLDLQQAVLLCSPEFKEKFMPRMNSKGYASLDDLPEESYLPTKNWILINADNFQNESKGAA